MAAPTKEAIIGTFINGRNAQLDFLQLAENNGGTVFAWIDYLGHLQGSLADGIVDLTAGQVGFGSSTNTVIGDPGFLYDQSTQVVTIGSPISDFSPIVPTERGHLNVFEANTGEMGILSLVQDDGTLTGAGITQFNEFLSIAGAAVPSTQIQGVSSVLFTNHTGTTLSAVGLSGTVTALSSGAVGEINGIEGYAACSSGTGLVTWLSSIRAAASTPLATGNQTVNNASLYIEGPNTGAVNTYSIYMAGPDSPTDPNTFAIFSAAGVNHFEGTATATPVEIANSTAATGGANQSSPFLAIKGTYWTGSASASDEWSIQDVLGSGTNPSSVLTFVHTGTPTQAVVSIPNQLTITNAGSHSGVVALQGSASGSAGWTVAGVAGSPNLIAMPAADPIVTGSILMATVGNPTQASWTNAPIFAAAVAATGGANQSSPIITSRANYWDGAASQPDDWTIQNVLGSGTNPVSTLTIAHSGSPTPATVIISSATLTTGVIQSTGMTASGNVNIANNHAFTSQSANGSLWTMGLTEEEITLNTGGTTTDSSTNLLPAGAIIHSVVARVTQTISGGSTPTTWEAGDPTTAARFISTGNALTAGTTAVGLNQMAGSVTTDAAGPTQAAAAKVRITLDQIPGQGKVRITVFYSQFTAPTS